VLACVPSIEEIGPAPYALRVVQASFHVHTGAQTLAVLFAGRAERRGDRLVRDRRFSRTPSVGDEEIKRLRRDVRGRRGAEPTACMLHARRSFPAARPRSRRIGAGASCCPDRALAMIRYGFGFGAAHLVPVMIERFQMDGRRVFTAEPCRGSYSRRSTPDRRPTRGVVPAMITMNGLSPLAFAQPQNASSGVVFGLAQGLFTPR
jgi:hypothetical protein